MPELQTILSALAESDLEAIRGDPQLIQQRTLDVVQDAIFLPLVDLFPDAPENLLIRLIQSELAKF